MKIGIDARCLEEQEISGVGEYVLELTKSLLGADSAHEYIIFSNSFKDRADHLQLIELGPNVTLKKFSVPNKIFNFFLWYFRWPKLDKLMGDVDIFFAPNINFLSVSKQCPLVVTFHDLSFERYPEFLSFKRRLWHKYFVNPRKIARDARKIVAVSESTKKDLEELYKIETGKTVVVYHGVSEDFKIIRRNDKKLAEIRKKYYLPAKFILYLGNIEPRKNIKALSQAYDDFIRKDKRFKEYKLVLAGNGSQLNLDIANNDNLIICGYINRKDKPYIFNLASLFVYPSHLEGFGLPLLEAMACGLPVITAHNSSLPEVVESSAILINPNKPGEIAQAFKNILGNQQLYDTLKKRGIEQAKKFSWEKCARETLKILAN